MVLLLCLGCSEYCGFCCLKTEDVFSARSLARLLFKLTNVLENFFFNRYIFLSEKFQVIAKIFRYFLVDGKVISSFM